MNRTSDRHLKHEHSNSKIRFVAASAFTTSTMVGMVAPVAFATTDDSVEKPEAAAATVSVTPEVVSVPLASTAEGTWEFEAVTIEATEPVVQAAPVTATEQSTPAQGQVAVAAETTQAEATPAAPAPTEAAAPVAAPASSTSGIVNIARAYVGSPYVYGGSTPAGFDCSGFTSYVYAQAGISLPRPSSAQLAAGYQVSAAEAQPGDLVWWPGHVGIYTGNGQHIAARNPAAGVKEGPVYGSPIYVRIAG